MKKSARFLRSTKIEQDDNDGSLQDSEEEERIFNPNILTPIDDLLGKLAINDAVALRNLSKYDKDLLKLAKSDSGIKQVVDCRRSRPVEGGAPVEKS